MPPSGEPRGPVEPPPSTIAFPPAATADDKGCVLDGGDLEPGTLLAAYRSGLFPMRRSTGEWTWLSPDPRGILPVGEIHVTKSLRRSLRRFETTVDSAFAAVVDACADRAEDEYLWLTPDIRAAYCRLHDLGWAHSVETWEPAADGEPRRLVGGLYGIAVGGLFSGESMFHRETDASKVALVALGEVLAADARDREHRIIDVQWLTPHMASLGAVEIPREEYLSRLERALELPPPPAFRSG